MADDDKPETTSKRAARKAPPPAPTPVALVAALALAAGGAGGWFARDANARQKAASSTAAPASSAAAPAGGGVCGEWAGAVCARAGETSEGCAKAKAAASLLSAAACTAAKADVDATITKLKAARASCETLVEKLCADLGPQTKTCGMVREKTGEFPAERCKEMLDQYAGVIGELKELEQANAPITADLARRQSTGDAPGFGPADAKLTVVEYSDFQCPFCGRAATVVDKLKEKYGSKVRFVFRQFPLDMHPDAQLTAEAALAAQAQGKFWAFHDLVFGHQRELSRADLEKYAKEAGLDVAKFKAALDAHTYAAAVKADRDMGIEAKVNGTPSMFIGAQRAENPTDFDALAKEIDQKLSALN
jgi:protein-disulfide isomerase